MRRLSAPVLWTRKQGDWLEFQCPLDDPARPEQEPKIRLSGACLASLVDENVSFQLMVLAATPLRPLKHRPIDRIDWRPIGEHVSHRAPLPPHIPYKIPAGVSHRHDAQDNQRFSPKLGLPWAYPLANDPPNYAALCDWVARAYDLDVGPGWAPRPW